MAKHKIGGSIVLEGDKAYKQALKDIKSAHTELRSEMKLADASFKDNQNSLEALRKKHEILSKQVDLQRDKVEVLQKAVSDSVKKEEEYARKVDSLREALSSAEKEMSDMEKCSDSTAEAMADQQKAVDELKGKLKLAEEGYDKAVRKTESYQTSLNLASATLKDMESELDNAESHMREAEQSTDKCATSIDRYGKEVNQASEQTSIFGDVLKANLMSGAIIAGVKKLADGIKEIAVSAVDAGSSFEASMSQVAATMGMTAEEVKNGSKEYTLLSDAAKECGKATMFSASQAGEALNYLALAGYDAQKSAETLPKVLDLAAAGGLDLAYASDLVTDSMAALGMEASQLDTYIDEMARTSQKSNTSVAQLGEATLVCAGAVSMTKQNLETMNAELGVLANNGIKGAEGGTHLRNILLSLSAPVDKAADAIDALGLQVYDSSGNMRDLNDILIDLNSLTAEMSSEERTGVISKIFKLTDIAAINALLKGTGDEFDSLKAEIESSQGAAAAMAETLNDNLKGKVTILQSALEGLGISAYEIFDDNLKTFVDSATNAVGRLQRSIESGNMGVSLRRMSDALGKFLDNAIDVGEDALPVLIDGFTWLLDNADLVASGVAGIVAANVTMGTVVPAVEAVSAAWSAYKTANDGATVSQWLLNAAMNANPAGILITAITGLTVAVGAYLLMNKDNLTTMDETTQKTRDLIEETRALNESYASSAAERSTARGEMDIEAATCRNLVAELEGLRYKTSLTSAEQARQKAIVAQLNQAMPELNLSIDEQTGKLNMSTEALEDNIDALMRQGKIRAAQEDLTRIAEEQYEAQKQLAKLEEQRAAQLEQVEKAQSEYNERMQEAKELYGENSELYGNMGVAESEAIRNTKAAYGELDAEIKATQETIDGFTQEYAETLEYISDTEAIDNAAESTQELGNASAAAGAQVIEMSEEMQKAYEDMYESVSDTLDAQMNLFAKFEEQTAVSKDELLANMQSQIDGVTNWAENMEALGNRGIEQGLLQKLAQMGPEGSSYVAAFVEMTDDELAKANDLFLESLTLKAETTDAIMQDWMKAGTDAAEGFQGGIEEGAEDVTESGIDLAKEVLDGMKETLDEHSPSKKTQEIAENADIGLIQGFEGKKGDVLQSVQGLMSQIIITAKDELKAPVFTDIGRGIMDDMAAGILDGKGNVISAINSVISGVVEAAMEELDFKAGELSRMAEESYAEIEKGAKGGGKAGKASADQETAQAQKAIARAAANMQNAVYANGATSRQPVNVTVKLSGDAADIFKAVSAEEEIFYKSTGKGRFDHT